MLSSERTAVPMLGPARPLSQRSWPLEKGRRLGAFLPGLFPVLECPSRGIAVVAHAVKSLVSTGEPVEPPDWTTVKI